MPKNQEGDSSASNDFLPTLNTLKFKRRVPFVSSKPLQQTDIPVHVISGIRYFRSAVTPVVFLSKGTPLHFKCRMYIAQRDFTKIEKVLLELFLVVPVYRKNWRKRWLWALFSKEKRCPNNLFAENISGFFFILGVIEARYFLNESF